LEFGKYYSNHFVINGKAGKRYGLFFISSNLYGLEKFNESAWKVAPHDGRKNIWREDSTNFIFDVSLIDIERDSKLASEHALKVLREIFVKQPHLDNSQLYEACMIAGLTVPLSGGAIVTALTEGWLIKEELEATGKKIPLKTNKLNYENFNKPSAFMFKANF
jgi:hypothetical protein